MKIITNNVPRYTIDAVELAPAERERFDYLDWDKIDAGRDSATFFRYRGELYDLGEFMRVEPGGELQAAGWHACRADSAFSGVVVKLADDGEEVIVGLALS